MLCELHKIDIKNCKYFNFICFIKSFLIEINFISHISEIKIKPHKEK